MGLRNVHLEQVEKIGERKVRQRRHSNALMVHREIQVPKANRTKQGPQVFVFSHVCLGSGTGGFRGRSRRRFRELCGKSQTWRDLRRVCCSLWLGARTPLCTCFRQSTRIGLPLMFHAAISMLAWAPKRGDVAAPAQPKSMFGAGAGHINVVQTPK